MSAFNPFDHIAAFETDEEMKLIESKKEIHPQTLRIQLLMNGYIREIQSLLKKENIIPDNFNNLCMLFHQCNNSNIFWEIRKIYLRKRSQDANPN